MILWFMKKQTKGNLKAELKMKNIILLLMAGLIVSCTTTQKAGLRSSISNKKHPNFVVADFRNIAQET